MLVPDNGNVDYGSPIGFTYEQFSHYGHLALDLIGIIDPIGIADGANALWYAAEGDYANAAISAGAIIPIAGGAIVGARLAKRTSAVIESGPEIWGSVTEPCGGGVYVLINSLGEVGYVGQTNDFLRRSAEWMSKLDPDEWTFEAILDIADAVERTIAEQMMINLYDGVGGGQLFNAINAISKKSPLFQQIQDLQ